ncbi:MAG: MBL fold metallo-hydrolase [Planctomycetota bacterium]|nr:MBL fold metallo-hydrolase [Planctomycetota bacterium]
MRLTFLGTGTSAGVPAIGCDCRVCTSADPRDQRLRTSAMLTFRGERGNDRCVLIDAGPDLRQQALRAKMQRLDAVLFTHNHVDHTFGLDEVRRFNAIQKGPIEVYAEDHTMEHLQRVYAHIFQKDRNVNDSFVATLSPHRARVGVAINLWGLQATPIRVLHGKLPIVGYRFDAAQPSLFEASGAEPAATPNPANDEGVGARPILPLAYCTDVSAIPPETWPRLQGLQTLVLDALRLRHHPTHLTLEQAVNIAHEAAAARTYFVHMAHDLPHEETQASLPPGMFLAYDGLVI